MFKSTLTLRIIGGSTFIADQGKFHIKNIYEINHFTFNKFRFIENYSYLLSNK